METYKECYLGLGGNIGNSFFILTQALCELQKINGIFDLKISRPFRTSPVSNIAQNYFINAACQLKTNLSIETLFAHIQDIETRCGKTPKAKNAPRKIDIDLILYGSLAYNSEILQVPHPRFEERLFVIAPLCDLTEELSVPGAFGNKKIINLRDLYNEISAKNKERVFALNRIFEV